MLTQAYLQTILSYDPDTGIFTWLKSIRYGYAGRKAGCIKRKGYVGIIIGGKSYLAHRLAWLYSFGEWPSNQIDHINGDKADNRISNLREANASENAQNQFSPKSHNPTKTLGVRFNQNGYEASIKINSKNVYLGRFSTPEEAHKAYVAAKRKLHSHGTL